MSEPKFAKLGHVENLSRNLIEIERVSVRGPFNPVLAHFISYLFVTAHTFCVCAAGTLCRCAAPILRVCLMVSGRGCDRKDEL